MQYAFTSFPEGVLTLIIPFSYSSFFTLCAVISFFIAEVLYDAGKVISNLTGVLSVNPNKYNAVPFEKTPFLSLVCKL